MQPLFIFETRTILSRGSIFTGRMISRLQARLRESIKRRYDFLGRKKMVMYSWRRLKGGGTQGGGRWPTSPGRKCISTRNSRPWSFAAVIPKIVAFREEFITTSRERTRSIRQVNTCASSYPARCVLSNSTLLSASGRPASKLQYSDVIGSSRGR